MHSPLNLLGRTREGKHTENYYSVYANLTSFAICLWRLSFPINAHHYSICNRSIDLLPNKLSLPLSSLCADCCVVDKVKHSHAALEQLFFHLRKWQVYFERKTCTKQSLQCRHENRKTTRAHFHTVGVSVSMQEPQFPSQFLATKHREPHTCVNYCVSTLGFSMTVGYLKGTEQKSFQTAKTSKGKGKSLNRKALSWIRKVLSVAMHNKNSDNFFATNVCVFMHKPRNKLKTQITESPKQLMFSTFWSIEKA